MGIVVADIVVHHIMMTAIAGIMRVKVVINNARVLFILIVMICRQVVEPLAVPRSSKVAAATTAAPSPTAAPTPTSVVSSCPFGFY